MGYFLRSRGPLKNAGETARVPVTPLSAPLNFVERAAVFEIRAIERSRKIPTASDLFDGEDLTELSDTDEDELREPEVPVATQTGKGNLQEAPPKRKKPETESHRPSHRNRKRARVRKDNAKQNSPDKSTGPSPRTVQEALRPAQPLHIPVKAVELDAAYGGHTGKTGKRTMGKVAEREAEYDVDELVRDWNFLHYQWDGITPVPIIDETGIVVSSLVGRPTGGEFNEDMVLLYRLMVYAWRKAALGNLLNNKKRGGFPAITKGVTMGMGSKKPVLVNSNKQHPGVDPILQELLDHPALKRLSSFHNSSFKLWGPDLHDEYRSTVETMYSHPGTSHLPRLFEDSVFTACAFNFGGRVRTYKHRDHLNWAFGWCAITALGTFDPKKSARLILWEFKLVIDFPPGSTVLIPSAVITHSNTPIAEGDGERTSFTQYSAGAIFRWAENGCMTEGELKVAQPGVWADRQAGKAEIAASRVKLYSKLTDILDFE
ncbi:hypothetical protein V5O48_006706 [Marasmius crinis-equi]|uniref:Uncharacterized protein n=1 Tax=Marasmius crinis-equi TaxID=585013 RepID=A0ABR3FIS3_9AGAR